MIIYRLTDRIPVKIDDLTFWVAPMSFAEKLALNQAVKTTGGVEVMDAAKVAFLTIKFSVKEVEGIKLPDGSDYPLSFDASGALTDDCVSELLQIDTSPKLVTACGLLTREIKEHSIKGVKIDLKGVRPGKKSAA